MFYSEVHSLNKKKHSMKTRGQAYPGVSAGHSLDYSTKGILGSVWWFGLTLAATFSSASADSLELRAQLCQNLYYLQKSKEKLTHATKGLSSHNLARFTRRQICYKCRYESQAAQAWDSLTFEQRAMKTLAFRKCICFTDCCFSAA